MATNERYVSTNADIKVARSRMPLTRRSKWSYFHGYLHPVGSPIEVLPGDTIKAKLSLFTRMSTPVVPFMDDIRQEVDAFFVPKRILWSKTKQFYGEAPSFGIATKVYEPRSNANILWGASSFDTNLKKCESFAAAFGLVLNDYNGSSGSTYVNLLPIRSFLACYNEYFRDENFQDQYTWDKASTGDGNQPIAFLGSETINGIKMLPVVNKDRDVVTSILPWAQKGDPVSIGLTGNVPVIGGSVTFGTGGQANIATAGMTKFGNPIYFGTTVSAGEQVSNNGILHVKSPSETNKGLGIDYDSGNIPSTDYYSALTSSNLVADLSSATAVKINDLLYALAYQDFLARCAHFGTRYKEYIYAMFGTQIADATEDIPEYLGRLKMSINVQQVVQTTGFSASTSTELGSLGAYSNSGKSSDLFTKSFTEPGYIVFVSYTKHQRTYSSGIDRVFLKSDLLDYYQTPFANIPDVPYGSYNVWLNNEAETSLGFQEPWYDYRALQDRAYGMMNPMIDTLGEIWTLAEKWTSKPTIAGDFMKEDRECIARVLATGQNGPDYLCDALLELDATRVMPLYSSGKLERF